MPDALACRFLDAATVAQLAAARAAAGAALADVLRAHPVEPVQQAIYGITGYHLYHHMPDAVWATLEAVGARHGAAALGGYKKYLVLALLADVDDRLAAQRLPDSVLACFPEMFAIVARDLLHTADADYLADKAAVLRELRLAALRSIPAGARVVDRDSCVTRSFYRYHGKRRNLRNLWFVVTRLGGGLGPLYRPHIETRHLTHANEQGYTEMFLRVAEMMRDDPQARGSVGTSWLMDPAIERVSPHLAYVRRLPMDNGAFSTRDGVGQENTERALAASRTRRAAYEAGSYQPACYTVIWPRRDLLRWAARMAGPNGGRP